MEISVHYDNHWRHKYIWAKCRPAGTCKQLEFPNKRSYLNDVLKGCSLLTKKIHRMFITKTDRLMHFLGKYIDKLSKTINKQCGQNT